MSLSPTDFLTAGLGGAASFLGSPTTTQTQKINQNQQTAGQTTSNNNTLPVWDPATNALRLQLLQAYGQSAGGATDLSGYTAQGQSQINQNADARTSAISNALASRGLSYSPISAIAPAMSNSARIGDQSTFLNSIPLLQQQLQAQKLAAAGGFLKGLPIGQTSDAATSNQSGVQTTGNNVTTTGTKSSLAGSIGSAATILAGLAV